MLSKKEREKRERSTSRTECETASAFSNAHNTLCALFRLRIDLRLREDTKASSEKYVLTYIVWVLTFKLEQYQKFAMNKPKPKCALFSIH